MGRRGLRVGGWGEGVLLGLVGDEGVDRLQQQPDLVLFLLDPERDLVLMTESVAEAICETIENGDAERVLGGQRPTS